ncbi:uncharacterized protein [Parasteatoda tepidariorum]|uniref:uncharacterized protein n=1 Tax=Parasteatoda tepidariorum TaxID=114398 RepID=UPI001C71E9D3|nr:uncharacterized protein LOC107447346 [Parasteatoda tepidariorum]XP_042895001.1 uncharacterized protein LOC107447346 [Parasteatoda tepidariorum]
MESQTQVIVKLKSKNSSEVYEALKVIRRNYVRDFKKMKGLESHSVIPLLISFIEHPKFSSISLSIIADACMERYWIAKVIENKGIESLVRIMGSLINDDIINRACRALGNIAKFNQKFSKNINISELITNVIKFLTRTSEVNAIQTAVRTLRILGNCPKSCDLIIRESGIIHLSRLLCSSDKNVILCSTQAIADLTENCNSDYVAQLLEGETLNILINLFALTEFKVKLYVTKSLKNLSCHEAARSSLTKVGAIKIFSQVAIDLTSPLEIKRYALLGLCNCLNYWHMWSAYGISMEDVLKPLISALTVNSLKDIHRNILNSFCPFAVGEITAEYLINSDLISVLVKGLKQFINCNEFHHEKSAYCMNVLSTDAEYSFSRSKLEPNLQLNIYDDKGKIKQNGISSCVKIDTSRKLKTHSDIESSNAYSGCSPTSDYFSSSCSPDRNSSKKSPTFAHSDSAFSPNYYSDSSSSPVSSHVADVPWKLMPLDLDSSNLNSRKLTDNCSSSKKSPSSSSIDSSFSPFYYSDSSSSSVSSHVAGIPCKLISSNLNSNNENSIKLTNHYKVKPKKYMKWKLENEKDSSSFLQSNKHEDLPYLCYDRDSSDSEKYFSEPENVDFLCPKRRKKDILKLEEGKNLVAQGQSANHGERKRDDICIEKFNHYSNTSSIYKMDHLILHLLYVLSCHLKQKNNPVLANKSNYSILMIYIVYIKNPSPKAESILLSLIKNKHFFEFLIQNGFYTDIEEIFVVYHGQKCDYCGNIFCIYRNLYYALCEVAETEFGIGTLCHILCISDKEIKSHALLAISKLVSNRNSLYKLLILANGLRILFQFLSEFAIISIKDIKCLCQLFQNLNKDNRLFLKNIPLKYSNTCVYKNDIFDVTFVVNGGMAVGASRDKICTNSDYFNALLKGYFKEQCKTVLSISGISAETLQVIFHFLHGCCKNGYCPYLEIIPFEILMELLSECEKFLLHDIKLFAENRLCHHFSPETAIKVYQFAKLHNSVKLYNKVIEYILSLDVSTPKILNIATQDVVLKCFQQFIKLNDDFCVFEDVEKLMLNLLL